MIKHKGLFNSEAAKDRAVLFFQVYILLMLALAVFMVFQNDRGCASRPGGSDPCPCPCQTAGNDPGPAERDLEPARKSPQPQRGK